MGKPAVACLLGYDGQIPKGLEVVTTLEEAAITAVRLTGAAPRGLDRPAITSSGTGGSIIGLYTGGTLCEEARRLVGGRVHRFVDFGAEEYMRGRPHPIIDPSLRHTAIVDAAGDGRASVIVLDVILGDCAHPDPAGALAPVLVDARERAHHAGRSLSVVAHVVGTDEDPQGLGVQESALRKVGAIVCASNRIAAQTARDIAEARRAG